MLYMIELHPDMGALVRFLHDQGLASLGSGDDFGYGIHAWLAAAFGKFAPKPWRLFMDRRRPPRILGYSSYDATHLRQHLQEFADPSVMAVCPDPEMDIASKPMPAWERGRRLGFEVQCCPVGRKAASGVEKDLFLLYADKAGDAVLRREDVYTAWVSERLQRNGAATIDYVELSGFRLVRQYRRTQDNGSDRRMHRLIRPSALLRGRLMVNNPDAFTSLLAHGVGRHRSFGYGMLLLRPV